MYPAGHGPVQAAEVRPGEAPNTPAGHREHPPAAAKLYCPGEHTADVLLVEPTEQ